MRASHFSADIREFLRLLAAHRVRYVIVGGEAVIYHGHARLTGAFQAAWESRVEEHIELGGGRIPVYFIGKDMLVRNMESMGRNKDQDDLRYLK